MYMCIHVHAYIGNRPACSYTRWDVFYVRVRYDRAYIHTYIQLIVIFCSRDTCSCLAYTHAYIHTCIHTWQIKADCEFLERIRVMDYSLLLGIHWRDRQPGQSVSIYLCVCVYIYICLCDVCIMNAPIVGWKHRGRLTIYMHTHTQQVNIYMHTHTQQVNIYMHRHTQHIHAHTHNMYMHTHTHTHMHAYVHTCIQEGAFESTKKLKHTLGIHTCIHTYILCTFMCTCRWKAPDKLSCYKSKHIHTYIHSYIHTYTDTYIHVYIHTAQGTSGGQRN
jgi:hypothetical protein